MFLQSIQNLKLTYASLDEKSELICFLKTSGGLLLNFFPAFVTFSKDQSQIKLDYDELAAVAVKRSGTNVSVVLNSKKISCSALDEEKASQDENLLKSIHDVFRDGSDSSPYENVRILCEENGIFFDGNYNKYLYHLIFEYNNLFNLILQNNVIPENSSIEFLLEEHTAGVFDNAAGTVTNLANSFFSGNLVGTLIDAGKRIAKSVGNELIGNSGIIVVTNENVLFAKGTDVEVIGDDIQEAWDALEAERDTTIQGAMDIYHDGAKILDNVSGKLWSEYKNVLRKLKNHPKQNLIEDNSNGFDDSESLSFEQNADSSSNDDVEEKLTKLKRMLDNGLISSDDYDRKKNEILGLGSSGKNLSANIPSDEKKTPANSQPAGKAIPLEKKKVVNNADEKSKKKHGCLIAFLIAIGVFVVLPFLIIFIVAFVEVLSEPI